MNEQHQKDLEESDINNYFREKIRVYKELNAQGNYEAARKIRGEIRNALEQTPPSLIDLSVVNEFFNDPQRKKDLKEAEQMLKANERDMNRIAREATLKARMLLAEAKYEEAHVVSVIGPGHTDPSVLEFLNQHQNQTTTPESSLPEWNDAELRAQLNQVDPRDSEAFEATIQAYSDTHQPRIENEKQAPEKNQSKGSHK